MLCNWWLSLLGKLCGGKLGTNGPAERENGERLREGISSLCKQIARISSDPLTLSSPSPGVRCQTCTPSISVEVERPAGGVWSRIFLTETASVKWAVEIIVRKLALHHLWSAQGLSYSLSRIIRQDPTQWYWWYYLQPRYKQAAGHQPDHSLNWDLLEN